MPLLRQPLFFLIDRTRKKSVFRVMAYLLERPRGRLVLATGLRLSLAPKEGGVGWLATSVGSHQSLWYLERQQAEAWWHWTPSAGSAPCQQQDLELTGLARAGRLQVELWGPAGLLSGPAASSREPGTRTVLPVPHFLHLSQTFFVPAGN